MSIYIIGWKISILVKTWFYYYYFFDWFLQTSTCASYNVILFECRHLDILKTMILKCTVNFFVNTSTYNPNLADCCEHARPLSVWNSHLIYWRGPFPIDLHTRLMRVIPKPQRPPYPTFPCPCTPPPLAG